jgi:hypothetical protein
LIERSFLIGYYSKGVFNYDHLKEMSMKQLDKLKNYCLEISKRMQGETDGEK